MLTLVLPTAGRSFFSLLAYSLMTVLPQPFRIRFSPARTENAQLLALAPGTTFSPREDCRCHSLLLPSREEGGAAQPGCQAAQVVSYGSAARDSLTFSSAAAGRLGFCLQRELLTLTDTVWEPQEFFAPGWLTLPPARQLFWAGILLLLGVSPAALQDLPLPPACVLRAT